MNKFLWMMQILLSIKLIATSLSHSILLNRPAMQAAIKHLGASGRSFMWIVAMTLLILSFGLVLPVITRTQYGVSITALILTGCFLASLFFHVRFRTNPNIFASIVLILFSLFIAYQRWPHARPCFF